MKLLLDQNLSPRLVNQLADLYPDSAHVLSLGLERSSDDELWSHAQANGFMILSKDGDFSDLAILRGFPPKVIWLQLGNCTTGQVATALRGHFDDIRAFQSDLTAGTFVLR